MSELYKKLTAEFPSEALSKDTSRGFELTSVKAQYLVERMNEVFGPEGWRADYVVIKENEQGIVMKCVVIANANNGDTAIQRSGFGGAEFSAKKSLSDIYKSAMTDSLSKTLSHIGVANDVFKGKVKVGGGSVSPQQAASTTKRTPRL